MIIDYGASIKERCYSYCQEHDTKKTFKSPTNNPTLNLYIPYSDTLTLYCEELCGELCQVYSSAHCSHISKTCFVCLKNAFFKKNCMY